MRDTIGNTLYFWHVYLVACLPACLPVKLVATLVFIMHPGSQWHLCKLHGGLAFCASTWLCFGEEIKHIKHRNMHCLSNGELHHFYFCNVPNICLCGLRSLSWCNQNFVSP